MNLVGRSTSRGRIPSRPAVTVGDSDAPKSGCVPIPDVERISQVIRMPPDCEVLQVSRRWRPPLSFVRAEDRRRVVTGVCVSSPRLLTIHFRHTRSRVSHESHPFIIEHRTCIGKAARPEPPSLDPKYSTQTSKYTRHALERRARAARAGAAALPPLLSPNNSVS